MTLLSTPFERTAFNCKISRSQSYLLRLVLGCDVLEKIRIDKRFFFSFPLSATTKKYCIPMSTKNFLIYRKSMQNYTG
jgi:hypothetical protein